MRKGAIVYTLLALLLSACEPPTNPGPQAPPPPVPAAPSGAFGHIRPIQLPSGEYFEAFYVTPKVWSGSNVGGSEQAPERYFFSTSRGRGPSCIGTHVLRGPDGVPVMVVLDPAVP